MRNLNLAVLVLAAAFTAGCRTTGSGGQFPSPTPAPAVDAAAKPRPGDIVARATGEQVSFDQMLVRLAPMRAVFVGESNNNMDHHRMQLDVVRAMHAMDPKLVIGMEMFQRPYQGALDRFIAGETDEATFLAESEYFKRWRWDWQYYRPVLLFARDNKIPVIALNSPAEANRQVARGTAVDDLPPELRQWVAEDVDLGIEDHRKFVMRVFESHPMGPGFDKDAFYASQCVWEDTMAESTARALTERPGHRIVVLVGSGHVRMRFGVPVRAERRGAAPYAIVMGEDLRPERGVPTFGEYLEEDTADYLFFTRAAPMAGPTPKLGVELDSTAGGPGLAVKKVTPGGIAALAGVADGDRIVGLGDRTISNLEDLQIALALLDDRMSTIIVVRGGGPPIALSFDKAWAAP